jgi:hypothetical protein
LWCDLAEGRERFALLIALAIGEFALRSLAQSEFMSPLATTTEAVSLKAFGAVDTREGTSMPFSNVVAIEV